jgi:type I restriction enzyme S subunit
MSSELRALWESAGGKIPDDWEIVPLEELFRDAKGIAVGVMYPGDYSPGGVPLIKVGDIKSGIISSSPDFCISEATNHEYRRSQLVGDELLITLVGNPGECVVVTPAMAGWNPARAIAVMKLKDSGLRTYVKTVLESSAGRHLIDSVLNTTVQKTLNLKDIRRLPIPMPSRGTIKNISDMAEAFSDRITLLRETNTTLEAIAQTLFKSWFVDFDPVHAKMQGSAPEGMDEATATLFPDSFEDSELGAVPKGWSMISFRDSINVIGGGTPKTSVPEYWGGDIPWFSVVDAPSTSDVFVVDTEKHITEAGLNGSSTKLLPAGTTIISARGTVGRLALTGCPMAMNQSCYGLRGKAGDQYFTYFSTTRLVEQLKQRAHGSVFDTITQETFAGVSLCYPATEVIQAFEQQVEPLLMRIRENLIQSQSLASIRDTLLPRLISGQLPLTTAVEQVNA